jgi:hypothetical protein
MSTDLARGLFDLDISETVPSQAIKYGGRLQEFYVRNKRPIMVIGAVAIVAAAFYGFSRWKNSD